MEELQRKARKVKINYTGMEIKTKKNNNTADMEIYKLAYML